MKGELNLVRPVRGIKQAGLRLSEQSRLKFVLDLEESIKRDFVRLVQSCAKGKLVLVYPVRGIKREALHSSGTKCHDTRASPCPSGTKNEASGTSSVR